MFWLNLLIFIFLISGGVSAWASLFKILDPPAKKPENKTKKS